MPELVNFSRPESIQQEILKGSHEIVRAEGEKITLLHCQGQSGVRVLNTHMSKFWEILTPSFMSSGTSKMLQIFYFFFFSIHSLTYTANSLYASCGWTHSYPS